MSSCTARPRSFDHDESDFYDGVPQPFTATRYHSLAVVDSTVPADLIVTSRTEGGVIMGVRHEIAAASSACSSTRSRCSPRAGIGMLGNWLACRGSARGRCDRARTDSAREARPVS